MLFGNTVYAAGTQAAAAGQQQGGSPIFLILMIAVWIGMIYFLQKKRANKHQNMIDSLEVGDEVITSSGIKGEIVSFDEEFVDVRVDKGVKLTIKKGYIQSLHKKKATI